MAGWITDQRWNEARLDRSEEYQFSERDCFPDGAAWVVAGTIERDWCHYVPNGPNKRVNHDVWLDIILERAERIGYEVVHTPSYADGQLIDVLEDVREWKFDAEQQHYRYPCGTYGTDHCSGPCFDFCDCPHCEGGWAA